MFNGRTLNKSINKEFSLKGGKRIELINPTKVTSTISADEYRLPKKLEVIHAYHPRYQEIIEFTRKVNLLSIKETSTLKSKLLIKQKGLCSMCHLTLLEENGEFKYDGTSHICYKEENTSDSLKLKITNLTLVHATCHKSHPKHGKIK